MTSPTDQQDLLYDVSDRIGRITFNRPASRNAMTFAMYERLAEICAGAEAEGLRARCSPGQVTRHSPRAPTSPSSAPSPRPRILLDYEARLDRVLETLERCPVPTIAAIAGACTGGGAGIAAACDIRICAANARFGFPIARTLGNCLSLTNTSRLAALIGPARLTDMIFTARLVGAEEARAMGLVTEVVETREALDTRAADLAQLVASNAPLTLRATKEALRRLRTRGLGEQDRDLILTCYTSRDFREGMDAFLNKRQPQWRGE